MEKCAKLLTEEADAHNYRNLLAEQHVYWRDQGRNDLNFQQVVFERAAQENEQAARDEVSVAVLWATEMSRAEMLARIWCSRTTSRGILDFSSRSVKPGLQAGDSFEHFAPSSE